MAKRPITNKVAIEEKIKYYARIGTRTDVIAVLCDIDVPNLHERYGTILQTAVQEANGHVGNALYTKAINGDTQAQIFWMKTRAKWKETLDLSSEDGSMSTVSFQNAVVDALKKAHGKE
jgi:hypothetical protein